MQRRGAADARLAGLAGEIDRHAEIVTETAGFDHPAHAAELDRFQADAARGLARMMQPDVVE